MAKWQLQEAKSNLSKLIDRALTDGPQIINRHGVEVVVVIPVARYRKLTRPERNLADFLLHSPQRNSGLVVERDPDAIPRRSRGIASGRSKPMDYRDVIRSQYQAALEMLKQAAAKCPDALWNDPADKVAFWRVAYHALFFTHLYLQPTEKDFVVWTKHRKDYELMGPPPWAPDQILQIGEPYTRDEVLEYLDLCRQQVDMRTRQLDLDASSGFQWLPFGKLELQFYTIRHLQQHAGELMERLGSRAGIDVNWVGSFTAAII